MTSSTKSTTPSRSSLNRIKDIRHLKIISSPLINKHIRSEVFNEIPTADRGGGGGGSGGVSLASTWDGSEKMLLQYVNDRLSAAKYNIDLVTPNWCKSLMLLLIDSIRSEHCDLVEYPFYLNNIYNKCMYKVPIQSKFLTFTIFDRLYMEIIEVIIPILFY